MLQSESHTKRIIILPILRRRSNNYRNTIKQSQAKQSSKKTSQTGSSPHRTFTPYLTRIIENGRNFVAEDPNTGLGGGS